DVLKEELLYVHPVRDDEGRGLVWTGNGEGTPATPAPPLQSIPSPSTQATPSMDPAPPVLSERTPDAERRQRTERYCDPPGSSALSGHVDPEGLCAVVRAYQEVCAKVITGFEGHIAQYLGDGLLVYFGYPLAHEDDAQRAVRAGLGMV